MGVLLVCFEYLLVSLDDIWGEKHLTLICGDFEVEIHRFGFPAYVGKNVYVDAFLS